MVKRYIIPALSSGDLSIIHLGEEDSAAISSTKLHQRSDYIIHFVVSGKGVYQTKNDKAETENPLSANTAFAIYKYDTINYHSDENDPMHYFWIAFGGEESEKILNHIGFSRENPIIYLKNPAKIIKGFNHLFSELKKNDKYALFSAFFHIINLLKENNVMGSYLINDNSDTIFSRAIDFIKKNIYSNIKVKDLVDYLHIDQSYFTKAFKKRFNVLPHIYITKARLQQAEFLIKTTDKTITEVVDLLNFSDIYSFSKLFKKEFGISPTAYRKLLSKEKTNNK